MEVSRSAVKQSPLVVGGLVNGTIARDSYSAESER